MRRRFYWLVLGVLLAGLSLAATGSAASQKPAANGTVIFGADQEPGILNVDIIGEADVGAATLFRHAEDVRVQIDPVVVAPEKTDHRADELAGLVGAGGVISRMG